MDLLHLQRGTFQSLIDYGARKPYSCQFHSEFGSIWREDQWSPTPTSRRTPTREITSNQRPPRGILGNMLNLCINVSLTLMCAKVIVSELHPSTAEWGSTSYFLTAQSLQPRGRSCAILFLVRRKLSEVVIWLWGGSTGPCVLVRGYEDIRRGRIGETLFRRWSPLLSSTW